MSRVGKKPIQVLSGARIELKDNLVEVEGPRGKLSVPLHPLIKVRQEDGYVWVERLSEEKNVRALHGLTRSLINNLIIGVTQGFKKELEIVGIGYNAKMEGKKLLLQVGYSHPVYYEAPQGVSLSVRKERNFIITIEGIDKQKVGEAAAEIRRIRSPEPYKGKGIRYLGEHIRLKAGKKGAKA